MAIKKSPTIIKRKQAVAAKPVAITTKTTESLAEVKNVWAPKSFTNVRLHPPEPINTFPSMEKPFIVNGSLLMRIKKLQIVSIQISTRQFNRTKPKWTQKRVAKWLEAWNNKPPHSFTSSPNPSKLK